MILTRPIASLDTETTGTNVAKDRIIEFGVTVLHPDGSRKQWQQRFNPGIPIPPEATAVHGISDADVADKPPFSSFAAMILRALSGKDLAGYNLLAFDLPILDEELRRCGLKLDIAGVSVVDAAGIFFKSEPRTLTEAVKRYCGRSHEGAHGAAADADATLDVLLEQVKIYEHLSGKDIASIAEYSNRNPNAVDLAGKFYRDKDGDLRYSFGKSKDVKVRHDTGFGRWMLTKDFTGDTLDCLREELRRCNL